MLAEGYRASSGEARHVVDKRLSNFLHLGVLNAIAPHARVVVMRRDPLDTGVSCFMSHFRGGVEFGYDLAHIGHFQKMYDRLTAHWAGVIDLPMFELSYEELVADQRGVTERLLSFVGVGFDEACLRFHEGAHVTRTLSTEQVRRPMYAESVGRAERYGSRLDPLRAALGMPAFGE